MSLISYERWSAGNRTRVARAVATPPTDSSSTSRSEGELTKPICPKAENGTETSMTCCPIAGSRTNGSVLKLMDPVDGPKTPPLSEYAVPRYVIVPPNGLDAPAPKSYVVPGNSSIRPRIFDEPESDPTSTRKLS